MILLFTLIPLLSGLIALFIKSDRRRRLLLVLTAILHSGLAAASFFVEVPALFDGWLELDMPGRFFLTISSILFLAASFYAVRYLKDEESHKDAAKTVEINARYFDFSREAVLSACMLFFLATMGLVTTTQHLGLLWVAMEATTLATAPLIYFHRSHKSLEATWKYLLICSVGIGLALLGNMLLLVASPATEHGPAHLLLSSFISNAPNIQVQWLKMAFIFFIVGYGTKMGLAPMHTWLPDAHSEAPSFVSALLSGALLNCAFLGIMRVHQICIAAGQGAFSQDLLKFFGLISIFFAAVFIIGQKDYKRMLAYSSVEHMGILALGVGLGGEAVFGAMFHALNHSLTKGMLFLAAGNILAVYGTRSVDDVTGVYRKMAFTGVLWAAGFFAITGTPPFGLFISEFIIFKSAIAQGAFVTASVYLVLLCVIFIGMGSIFINMLHGSAERTQLVVPERESLFLTVPAAVLGLCTLMLGVYMPDFLSRMLTISARSFGGM